jgi:hypothetical protein
VLLAHLSVVEIRLGGVNAYQDHVLQVYDRVALSEESLEVQVADVSGVMVAGDDHYVLALDPADVFGSLLELLPVSCIGKISRDYDRGWVHVVYLDDRSIQKVWDKAGVAAVDIAYLANG